MVRDDIGISRPLFWCRQIKIHRQHGSFDVRQNLPAALVRQLTTNRWVNLDFSAYCEKAAMAPPPKKRPTAATKNPPILSQEFFIQNHADIFSCATIVIIIGMMAQVSTAFLHLNVIFSCLATLACGLRRPVSLFPFFWRFSAYCLSGD